MSKSNRDLQGKFVPYPISKGYFFKQKLWLRKNPWVTIGKSVIFPLTTKVLGTPLEINDGTVINGPMTIKGSGNVTIGRYGGIAENLFIISSNHEVDRADVAGKFSLGLDVSKGPTYIGNNVWLGDNVTILSGVTIGDGAVVGAGSIVTKDVPAFGIAVGVPAKTIKFRFSSQVIKQLLNLGWWYWDEKTVHKNKWFFSETLSQRTIDSLIKKLDLSKEQHKDEIRLNNSNDSNYLLEGWGPMEEARWMQKESAALVLKVTKPKKYTKLQFEGLSYHKAQFVEINLNGKRLRRFKIDSKMKKYEVPIKNLRFGPNSIKIICSTGLKPSDIDKKSEDKRTLYCCFSYFKLK